MRRDHTRALKIGQSMSAFGGLRKQTITQRALTVRRESLEAGRYTREDAESWPDSSLN